MMMRENHSWDAWADSKGAARLADLAETETTCFERLARRIRHARLDGKLAADRPMARGADRAV